MVWTGDGRVFFYNPSTRTSVWERPDELTNRSDVDKLVISPPEAVVNANSTQPTPTFTTNVVTTSSNSASATPKREKEGSGESSEEDEETPAKKAKTQNLIKGSCFYYKLRDCNLH